MREVVWEERRGEGGEGRERRRGGICASRLHDAVGHGVLQRQDAAKLLPLIRARCGGHRANNEQLLVDRARWLSLERGPPLSRYPAMCPNYAEDRLPWRAGASATKCSNVPRQITLRRTGRRTQAKLFGHCAASQMSRFRVQLVRHRPMLLAIGRTSRWNRPKAPHGSYRTISEQIRMGAFLQHTWRI